MTTSEHSQPLPTQDRGSGDARATRLVPVTIAVLIGLIAAAVGGGLGWWQWERAHHQAQTVLPAPPVPIAEATQPGGSATGMGQSVIVVGNWSDDVVALVPGKEVDGVAAVLLIRAFTVAADATGTDARATLSVVAGWLPEDAELIIPEPGMDSDGDYITIRGYIRGSEAPINSPAETAAPPGAVWIPNVSTASFAQVWPAPVYSAAVVDDSPAEGWRALPVPPAETSLDIRSLTYAIEWWLFGAFAVFVVARWIRDNGRSRMGEATEEVQP